DATPPQANHGEVTHPLTQNLCVRTSFAEAVAGSQPGIRDLERAGVDVQGDDLALIFRTQLGLDHALVHLGAAPGDLFDVVTRFLCHDSLLFTPAARTTAPAHFILPEGRFDA